MAAEIPDRSLSKLDSSQLKMMEEMCLVVDDNDNAISSASKIDCHRGGGIRHRAFSVLIFDSETSVTVWAVMQCLPMFLFLKKSLSTDWSK